MAAKTNVKALTEEILAPLTAEGYEVWNVEYAKEGGEKQLRVFVDKEGGIAIDECEYVSRFLSAKLDETDPIGEAYSLIVSSPGMDRPLLKDEHFARYIGEPVEVSLYKAFEGRKKFAALLGAKTDEELYLTPIDAVTLAPLCDETCVPTELVSLVRLMVVV